MRPAAAPSFKEPSKKQIKPLKELTDELDEIKKLPPGEEATTRRRDISARMDALNTQSDSQKKKAVRLDLQLQHETDELLVDCIVTHSLAKSHIRAEAKRTMDRLTSPIVEVQNRAAAAIDKVR